MAARISYPAWQLPVTNFPSSCHIDSHHVCRFSCHLVQMASLQALAVWDRTDMACKPRQRPAFVETLIPAMQAGHMSLLPDILDGPEPVAAGIDAQRPQIGGQVLEIVPADITVQRPARIAFIADVQSDSPHLAQVDPSLPIAAGTGHHAFVIR